MAETAERDDVQPVDGRRARSHRTRALIVDALMSLIEEGNLQPSSEEVADRAEVGHRTVFRHFQDMDSLYREINARLDEGVVRHIVPVTPEGPLADRVTAMVKKRTALFEQVKNFRRATEARRWSSEYLHETRARTAKLFRDLMFNALPEIKKKPAAIQSAAELLLSFEAWEQLRVEQKCSIPKARTAMRESVLKLLS